MEVGPGIQQQPHHPDVTADRGQQRSHAGGVALARRVKKLSGKAILVHKYRPRAARCLEQQPQSSKTSTR